MTRVLIGLAALWLTTCASAPPRDDAVILVGPNPTAPPPEPTPVPGDGAPKTSIFSEKLQAVRGGARVLRPYVGADPCRMALAGDSPVAKACSEGGRRRAVELMNSFVKRAAAEGITFTCVDCHMDEDDYSKLTPIADQEFRKLLFLARPAD